MANNRLDKYLNYEFHKEYCEIILSAAEFHQDFLDSDNHLLIDARNFPNLELKVLHPQKIAKLIPENYFESYISNCLAFSKVSVYLFSEEECFIICQQDPSDKISKDVSHAQEDTEKYIRAYKGGLVKDAYILAKEREIPVIFAIIDGEAKLISEEDMAVIIEKYSDYLGEFDDWRIIAVDTNPTLVSFLYINTKEGQFWYDVLSDEFESELFESWGLEFFD